MGKLVMTQCETCGGDPCANPGFCALCRKADAEKKKPRQDPHMHRLLKLMHPSVTLEQAYREINDPKNRPTPQVVVEAIMFTVRERGLSALKEPANVERLSRCDAAAMRQIEQSIARLKRVGGHAKD